VATAAPVAVAVSIISPIPAGQSQPAGGGNDWGGYGTPYNFWRSNSGYGGVSSPLIINFATSGVIPPLSKIVGLKFIYDGWFQVGEKSPHPNAIVHLNNLQPYYQGASIGVAKTDTAPFLGTSLGSSSQFSYGASNDPFGLSPVQLANMLGANLIQFIMTIALANVVTFLGGFQLVVWYIPPS
jgi:hypothetical protein